MFLRSLQGFVLSASAWAATAATRPEMLVSTDWLANHSTDSHLAILHVAANRGIYDAGHITGARFVALGELAVTRDGIPNELPPIKDLRSVFEAAGVADDSRIVVYSEASVLPATRAYFTLDYLGHGSQTALLDGGLEKWRAENRALSHDSSQPERGRFTTRPRPELVVPMEAVKRPLLRDSAADILLDVRAPSDYRSETGSHIPGAVNLFWMENQVGPKDQTLKPADDLRKM